MDPIWLSEMGTRLNVGGQFLGAFSHIQHGFESRRLAGIEADQLRDNAGQAVAASQVASEDVAQRTKQLTARALAVAAASGGGASDPSVVKAISSIAGEGAYRKALTLYQGQEASRSMQNQADATEYRGKSQQTASFLNAVGGTVGAGTSLIKGYEKTQSLRAKYGGSGPGMSKKSTDGFDAPQSDVYDSLDY